MPGELVAGLMLLFLFLAGGLVVLSFRNGKAVEKNSKEEEINDAVKKSLVVRDRLRRDTGYASRVRKRFTR